MFGETRAEARPRHHDKSGLRQRHGRPHIREFLDQPQIAKRLPESGHAEGEFLPGGGAGIHPDAAAAYHVAGGARSAGVDQYSVSLIDFDPTIRSKQFNGSGRELFRRRMCVGGQQRLRPRGYSQYGTWPHAVRHILPYPLLESVAHGETPSRQNMTLLVKSRPFNFNFGGIHFIKGMTLISLTFNHPMSDYFPTGL
jgi:hypothetical protein